MKTKFQASGMRDAAPGGHDGRDEIRKLPGRFYWGMLPCRDDLSRNAPRVTFIAVLSDHPTQFLLFHGSKELSGRDA